MRLFIFTFFLLTATATSWAANSGDLKKSNDNNLNSNTLPEVVVKGSPQSLTVPNLEAARKQINQTPGGVGIVSAEQYKDGRASTLTDVLGYAPGVYAQSRFGSDESRVSIRGSGIQRTFHARGIKILQDGIPLNEADGSVDFQSLDPLAQQYVEVYRGANALEYGSTTLGGAVNFVSPTGYDAPLTQARFEGGSFGYLRSQISSGHVLGPADYYVSLTEAKQHGFRGHAYQENKRLYSNYGIRINENVEDRFYVSLVKSKSDLPGNLTKAQMQDWPESAATGNITGNQKRNFDYIRLANKTTAQLGDDQRFELSEFWFYKDLFHPIFQVLDVESHNLGGGAKYVNKKNILEHKNIFTLGFSPILGLVRDTRYVNAGGKPGVQTADAKQTSYNLDFFAQDQFYLLSNFAMVGGLQWSLASRKSKDLFLTDGNHSGHPVYHGLSPKAGLRYELTERSQLFGNISRSFEPPSFGELSNVAGGGILNLNSQEGTTLEAGTRGKEGRFDWDFAYYFSWVDNELLSLNDGQGNPLGTVNAYRTHHQGIELGTGVDLWEGLLEKPDKNKTGDKIVLRGIYNWSRFDFINDPAFSNNPLPGIPEHFLRSELTYEHPFGIYFGPNLEWVFQQYAADMNRTLFADPYAIMGLKAGYRTKKGFSFFVEAKNLTNKNYAATTGVIADARGQDSAQFLPGEGRAWISGIEWKW